MSCSTGCSCGCCTGLHAITPAAVHNRPGLSRIVTRAGTHGRFLSTMLARLSASDYPELADLRTRDPADGSIALLDAWATVADVLTFYQERIANEGYLRTATERRSLVELGRLINYAPRPGVAASVYLAFEMEKEPPKAVIPQGTKANSIPGPGETMEAFETNEEISARPEWNAIRPRLVQPQSVATLDLDGLYLKGTATKLKVGDMLLLRFPESPQLLTKRITLVKVDHANDRTHVDYVPFDAAEAADKKHAKAVAAKLAAVAAQVPALPDPPDPRLRQPTVAPSSAARLTRSVAKSFATGADTLPRLATAFQPAFADTLYASLRNSPPKAAQQIEVYAMRIEARAFGHNAPPRLVRIDSDTDAPVFDEWDIRKPMGSQGQGSAHEASRIFLDNDYDVADDSRVVILSDENNKPIILEKSDSLTILTIRHVSLSAYGLSGRSLDIGWDKSDSEWIISDKSPFSTARSARIFLGSEQLELADAPVLAAVEGGHIELDGLYEGLDPGRWLIIEGERTDIPDANGNPIPGIRAAELVMLGAVGQAVRDATVPPPPPGGTQTGGTVPRPSDSGAVTVPKLQDRDISGELGPPPLHGDTYHTTITLAAVTAAGTSGLAYTYKRDTVTIYANVARATHGETRTETLGSGNAAEVLQQFRLKLPPLTYVPAQTPEGIASTLEVRVNDVLWHEAATLAAIGPNDRSFTTRTGDDDKVDIIFGNGRHGLRLPTGRENVKARYRNGIGKSGNVKARQISLLGSRPLGVKNVSNPMRASGGANRDEAEAIRRNAPLAILALDRLISATDYADFARSFGGIGKASAIAEKGGVEVVIAGVDDIAIDQSSDLFRTLKDALHRFGDPLVRVKLTLRERVSLVIQAGVRIEPDYLWEAVEPKIRAALLDTFSFENQALGAPVFRSHVMRAIHKVKGVAAADIDVFGFLREAHLIADKPPDLAALLTKATDPMSLEYSRIEIKRNEIAYLTPDVPETLILQEVTI